MTERTEGDDDGRSEGGSGGEEHREQGRVNELMTETNRENARGGILTERERERE